MNYIGQMIGQVKKASDNPVCYYQNISFVIKQGFHLNAFS